MSWWRRGDDHGPRPTASPSLLHYPERTLQVQTLARELWGDMDGVTLNQHGLGKGMTYAGVSLDEILTRLKAPQDFASSGSLDNAPAWVHRHTRDADIYFVANQADRPQHMEARFRVTGKDVAVWRPMDGSVTKASYTSAVDMDQRTGNRQPGLQPALYASDAGFTVVPLDLAERESVFIIFRNAPPPTSRVTTAPKQTTLSELSGSWTVAFPDHSGAPGSMVMPALTSWTSNADDGVKYFSGTATYTKTVQASTGWFRPGEHLYLDFDKVRDIAEVQINGKPVGVLWAPPYRLDVTAAMKAGTNRIEIKVTNEWTNRLIGDALLPPEKRILSQATGGRAGSFGSPPQLKESGLLGSVRLVSVKGESKPD